MKQYRAKYLYRTNYFNRSWTWIRRVIVLMILNLGVITLSIDLEFYYIKYIILVIITFYVLLKPKDDLAIDQQNIYHIKQSFFKPFSKIDRYKISDLYSIRCGGIHDDTFELVDFFNFGGNTGGYSNTIEMTFKDDRSMSLDVRIGRNNLDKVVALVNQLRKEKGRS